MLFFLFSTHNAAGRAQFCFYSGRTKFRCHPDVVPPDVFAIPAKIMQKMCIQQSKSFDLQIQRTKNQIDN